MRWRLKILILMCLPVLAIGGFFIFILNHWQEVYIEPAEESSSTGQTIVAAPESLPAVEESRPPDVNQQVQDIIQEAGKIVTQTQEVIAAIEAAKQKSSDIKAVYLNEFVANSKTPWATTYREKIKTLLNETELNGVVIDIKEAYGPDLPSSLETFIKELHQKNVWVIARICAFRDSSLKKEKPDWYLKDKTATSSDNIWVDPGGASWLDPSSPEVQQYLVDFSKKAIDLGFDELQFDYVRFPSDGNLADVSYPVYNGTTTKYEVIGNFFSKLSQDLKDDKPSIILSADLFGYIATQYQAFDIGQRLVDAGQYFDYLSFMTYPSHFYAGFVVPEDSIRGLPGLVLPYKSDATSTIVSNNPYQVIFRSVLSASDYLAARNLSAKVRPWLQDFNLKFDMERGIYYTADKIKEQIQAAQDSGSSGWLLWNSSNIYTEDALAKE